MRILEIGCGSCQLLAELKKHGHKVLGIDPSVFSQKEGRRLDINVILGFYPNKKIKGKFDLIIHVDVLEHASNPLAFLKSNYKHLDEGGTIVLSVPDNTDSIANGDISMLMHQHMSYFDKVSLKKILQAAGFSRIKVDKAKFGGSLNASARKFDHEARNGVLVSEIGSGRFRTKNNMLVQRLSKHVHSIVNSGHKSLGFYAPIRALPYLSLLNLNNGFRFFDDTSRWHRKYLDGIDVPVENFEDLKRKPVTDLIIMSPTFGSLIEKKVRKGLAKRIRIKKLSDFYEK